MGLPTKLRRVEPSIPKGTFSIAVLGEAPGQEEERQGKPFVGPSGALLMRLFAGVGLQREQLYITNVCKYRPPNNDIKRLPEIGVYFEDEASETMEELAALQSVNVIVAAGDTALDTLTGLHGISKWRGSVLYCHRLHKKVIPILHPAFLLRGMWEMWPVTRSDLARVVEESKTSGPPAKQPRCFLINPDFTTIITELERMQSSEYLSFDIEVRHKKIISCV
ncbi:MAG: uracil-DNA glycosylase, partial [Candidatus Micrarchaeota archaeon]